MVSLIMPYCNSLLLLRVFAVICTVLFARELIDFADHLLSELPPTYSSKGNNNENSLRWDQVDVFIPPPLQNSIYEGLRLNELLARSQIKCSNKVRVGGDSGFFVCNDSKYFNDGTKLGEALVISGNPFSDTSFITELNPSRWTMFIVQGFRALDNLGNVDVELHYILQLPEDGDWRFDELMTEIEGRSFDTALINFYCPFLGNGRQNVVNSVPEMLLKLMEVLNARQLHLLVNINRNSSNEVILEWYRAMYRIFFDYHYALFAAESTGICGRKFERCKYKLSFLRFSDETVELPVFGLGSPLEERKRLITYLLSNNYEPCNTTDFKKTGLFMCANMPQDNSNCSIIIVRYRNVEVSNFKNSFGVCEFILVSPILKNRVTFNGRFLNVGISLKNDSNMEVPGAVATEKWLLIPFAKILETVSEKLIYGVFLDLEGGEWDVFDVILNTPELNRIQHLGLRIRLWIGEENENFRRFLGFFLRLERLGFLKISGRREDDSAFEILFKRKL